MSLKMMIKAFILICAAALHCDATYPGGYGGLDYVNPGFGYAGIGYEGPGKFGYGTPGLQYNSLIKTPYSYPLNFNDDYYGGYNAILDPGFNPGYFNKGLYNAKPPGYGYGSNLGYYGNYGFPLKKR